MIENHENACVICGKPLTPNKNRGPAKLYCGNGHKSRAWAIRLTEPSEYERIRRFFDLTTN